jgi:hypothetical protein
MKKVLLKGGGRLPRLFCFLRRGQSTDENRIQPTKWVKESSPSQSRSLPQEFADHNALFALYEARPSRDAWRLDWLFSFLYSR